MGTEQMGTSRPAGAAAPSGESLSKAGRDYVTKARDAYQQLLTDVSKNPQLAPSGTAALAIKMQLGECYRASATTTSRSTRSMTS